MSERRYRRVLPAVIGFVGSVALIAAGVFAWAWATTDPALVPPDGLADVRLADRDVRSASSDPIDPAALETCVAQPLANKALGERVGFAALNLADGTVLEAQGSGGRVPASTTKILTAFATAKLIDADATFDTRVVRSGNTVTVIGGGDAYLTSEQLRSLAERAAAELDGARVKITYDVSLFASPGENPAWENGYVPSGVATPIAALWVDRGDYGQAPQLSPAKAAAKEFAAALSEAGVRVAGQPRRGTAPAGASEIARHSSAPVAEHIADMLATSNNEAAEVLLRHSAIAGGAEPSFAGGVATVREVLAAHDIDTEGLRLLDGSGLARSNRIAPQTLAQAIQVASTEPRLTAVLDGLPIAGLNGTLRNRFSQASDGRGFVHAKTGTLTGVHSLAGISTLPDGRAIAFALLADRTRPEKALQTQAALDAVAAAMSSCEL